MDWILLYILFIARLGPVTKADSGGPVNEGGGVSDYGEREKRHDWVRTFTACSFIGIFAVTVLGSFVVVIWFNSAWANAKELVQLLLPAETALIGSAIGFYFGSQKRD